MTHITIRVNNHTIHIIIPRNVSGGAYWYLTTTNLKDDGAILDEGTAATPQAACKAARRALYHHTGVRE